MTPAERILNPPLRPRDRKPPSCAWWGCLTLVALACAFAAVVTWLALFDVVLRYWGLR